MCLYLVFHSPMMHFTQVHIHVDQRLYTLAKAYLVELTYEIQPANWLVQGCVGCLYFQLLMKLLIVNASIKPERNSSYTPCLILMLLLLITMQIRQHCFWMCLNKQTIDITHILSCTAGCWHLYNKLLIIRPR